MAGVFLAFSGYWGRPQLSGAERVWAVVIIAVITAGGLVFLSVALWRDRRAQLQAKKTVQAAVIPEQTLEVKLDQLSAAMEKSARLVEQVTAELDARAATALRLRREAEDAEAIAAAHKEQTDAVRRMLRAEISTELATTERHIFWDSLKITIVSYILGVASALLITLLVHPLK